MTDSQLLQQIVDNTARNDSILIAIVAGASGVLGAGLTAWFGYLIAKKAQATDEKRLRAGIVTAERLRWLQDLRQRLARFYVQLDMQYNFLKRPIPEGGRVEYQQQLDSHSNEINEQCNIICLMMNPGKPNQQQLKNTLNDALTFVTVCIRLKNTGTPVFDDNQYRIMKTQAFDALTNIGIETWEQVKELV